MILAQHGDVESWDKLDQLSFMPEEVSKELSHTEFAIHGAPSAFTPIHGYDVTNYNGNTKHTPHDNFNVDGVYSGWTASDLTAPTGDVASLIYEVYGPNERVVSKKTQ
jgi:hypothetical protein